MLPEIKYLVLEMKVLCLRIHPKRSTRGQIAEARRTTVLQPVEGKPHSQKDRQNEKAEDLVPDEGARQNPRKTTK